MADKQRDDETEPLTERERGVLLELARQIVREAGLQRDPEGERIREGISVKLDTLRHTSTLAGATAVAVLLIQRAWDLDDRLVAGTLGILGVSFCLAVLGIMGLTGWLESGNSQLRRHYTPRRYYWLTFLCTLLLFLGVFLFGFTLVMAHYDPTAVMPTRGESIFANHLHLSAVAGYSSTSGSRILGS